MSLRHAILGLLSLAPMTGYTLKKEMDDSTTHFWAADQSQVYRTLTALVAEGLVERGTVHQESRPTQHPHAITPEGEAELDAWLRTDVDRQPARDGFLLRLFFIGRLGREAARDLLAQQRSEVESALAALEQIEADPPGGGGLEAAMRRATLARGIVHDRAELAWIEQTLAELDAGG